MSTETQKKIINARYQQKIDTSENWNKAVNFTPLKGELIVYSDLQQIKIGDGSTNVNDLPFINASSGNDNSAIELAAKMELVFPVAAEDGSIYTDENGNMDWSLVEDEQGHGTAVTGVIAASMNSGNVVGSRALGVL